MTTAGGPWFDDHFLMFISKDKLWHLIPMDVEGMNDLIKVIGLRFDISSFVQMANITVFKSRLIYPKTFEGMEYLSLQKIEAKRFWNRLVMSLGLKSNERMVVTEEFQENILSKVT